MADIMEVASWPGTALWNTLLGMQGSKNSSATLFLSEI